MQDEALVESSYHSLRTTLVSLLDVAAHLIYSTAINHGHHDVLIAWHLVGVLHNHGHSLVSIGGDDVALLLEALHSLLVNFLGHLVHIATIVAVLGEGEFHGKDFKELLAAILEIVALHDVAHAIPNHICNVHAQALAHESMTALLVDDGTLLVHHIIIFEQALAHTKVVLLHLLLSILDRAGNHCVLNHFAFLEA